MAGRHTVSRLRRAPASGFTVVELMVVIVIIGFLTAFAMPAFRDATQRTRVTAYANDVVASALRGRSEAIKRNAVVNLCPSSDGAACGGSDWSAGYILWCRSADGLECDPNNVATGSVVLHKQPAIRSGWRISSGTSAIAFQPSGSGATTAVLTVCQFEPSAGRQERVVTIGPTGRASVARTENGQCP